MGRINALAEPGGLPWTPHNFLALPREQSGLEASKVVLVPVPYDSSTSFRSGARYGPDAIIAASYALEDYDLELDSDVSEVGIHTTLALEPHMGGPDLMVQRVRDAVAQYMGPGRIVGVLGGDHSVAIGSVLAHLDTWPDMSVLYLDAHADLRDEYMGTNWGHASGARRIHDLCPVALVGVRSMCQEERDYIAANSVPNFPWPPVRDDRPQDFRAYEQSIVERLNPSVYVSVDLDVFDPSIMAAVGTPEPGGMTWDQVVSLLRAVAEARKIVGFDVCELSPGEGPLACSYTAAKLVYKLAAYATLLGHGE